MPDIFFFSINPQRAMENFFFQIWAMKQTLNVKMYSSDWP